MKIKENQNMARIENIEEFRRLVDENYIFMNKHEQFDLWICKYTRCTVLDGVWNDLTMMCRGLVIDADYNIVARPFRKFFNYEEITDKSVIPFNLPFEVYEKLDGSLGILYFGPDGMPYITTQGSFVSDQAQHANKVLYERYAHTFPYLDHTKTYLFEIIYPEDLHVVTYKDVDDIFLLGVIDIETGAEDDIYNWQHLFKCTKRYDGIKDFTKIREMFDGDNREGFVVKFANNFRLKMKFEYYFRLHALKANISPKSIFEMVSQGNEADYLDTIAMFDEEHQIFYNRIKQRYLDLYNEIEQEGFAEYETVKDYRDKTMTPEMAKEILKMKHHHIVFAKLKDKDYSGYIWKLVRKITKEEMKAKEDDDE